MIRAIEIENYIGESLYMELRKPGDTGFLVTSVTGLDYPKIDFSEQTFSNYDGSYYGGQHVQVRNIVMNVTFWEDNVEKLDIESLRWKWQRFLFPKMELTFHVHNDHGDFRIKGFVETNEINIFTSKESAQVSILCPDPYFVSDGEEQTVTVGFFDPAFEFPFSSEIHPLGKDDFIREEKGAPYPGLSLDVEDYYNIEYTNNGSGNLPSRFNANGKLATFLEGTEKLIYKRTLNSANGYTFEADLPDDYPGGDNVIFRNTFVEQFENEAGGYTARAEYANNSIEFGHIKSYPSTTIDYEGSAITGLRIIIEARGGVNGLRIDNNTRKEKIIINDDILGKITGYIRKYDQIIIDTTRGEKSAVLIRDGVSYNILNACLPIKNWIQLQTGPNVISYSTTSDIDLVTIKIAYSDRYLGV